MTGSGEIDRDDAHAAFAFCRNSAAAAAAAASETRGALSSSRASSCSGCLSHSASEDTCVETFPSATSLFCHTQ